MAFAVAFHGGQYIIGPTSRTYEDTKRDAHRPPLGIA